MTDTEERMLTLCEMIATVTGDTARLCVEVVEILQSALGLREGLQLPDEMAEPKHFLDGSNIRRK